MILRVDSPKPHQRIVAQTQLITQRPDVLFDQSGVKAVVSGIDRRVCRKTATGRRLAERGIEGETIFLNPSPNDLQRSERGVPFVHVNHARLNSDGRECSCSADPQHHFLPDANTLIAAVQPSRQPAILIRVVRDVCVEQIQRNATDVRSPYASENRTRPRLH